MCKPMSSLLAHLMAPKKERESEVGQSLRRGRMCFAECWLCAQAWPHEPLSYPPRWTA